MSFLDALWVQTLPVSGLFSHSFTLGFERGCGSLWKSLDICEMKRFDVIGVRTRRSTSIVKAIDTQWSEHSAPVEPNDNCSLTIVQLKVDSKDSMKVDRREELRCMRISGTNKGSTPWNKGRKHSAETIQKIRERTKLAMQDPKVKTKLKHFGHAQSEETRMKIGVRMRMGWKRRRKRLIVQATCFYQWMNLIAEASRRGLLGDKELQWDSYKIMDEQLEKEWLASIVKRKLTPRPKGIKRLPKSPEQRRKIAEAITAKWEDPVYRDNVYAGMSNYYGSPVGAKRKLSRRKSSKAKSKTIEPAVAEKELDHIESTSLSDTGIDVPQSRLKRPNKPLYKDPLARSKWRMIKKIKAERAAAEIKTAEAVEQARLLIDQAENAVKALELAAGTNHIARDSLLESRKIITEAVRVIESIDTAQILCDDNKRCISDASAKTVGKARKEMLANSLNLQKYRRVNGSRTCTSSSNDDNFSFSSFTSQNTVNGGGTFLPESSSFNPPELKHWMMENSCPDKQCVQTETDGNTTWKRNSIPVGVAEVQTRNEEEYMPSKAVKVKKKWVCGRLVEVTEST